MDLFHEHHDRDLPYYLLQSNIVQKPNHDNISEMNLTDVYQVGVSEKVKDLEKELGQDLLELRTELEEVDLPPKTTSSVPIPEGKEHFKRERKSIIHRALEVSEAQPVRLQAEEMRVELDLALSKEYTVNSLPLLAHQYFTERTQHLIHLRHLLMLRWKRFCEHTSTIESLYPTYSLRLNHLLNEYNDCVQRAQRLAYARESLMLDHPESGVTSVIMEDLIIYLRWLVCHLHSMKRFNQYLKVLQWLPVSHKLDIAPPDSGPSDFEETSPGSKMASRYQDDMLTNIFSISSRPMSVISGNSAVSFDPALGTNNSSNLLLSSSPLPASAFPFATAATGGALVSDDNLGLPILSMELDSFRQQLLFLMNVYGIPVDLNNVHNSADEMELFGTVNRKFKQVFIQQEQLNTFKIYDMIETSLDNSEPQNTSNTLKKEATWCEFVNLVPEKDLQQEKMWSSLHHKKYIDELLEVTSHFIHVKNCEKVQEALKKHAAQLKAPISSSQNASPHHYLRNTALLWKKIYSSPDLHANSESSSSPRLPDFDEKDIDNINLSTNRSSSTPKRKNSYDYSSTVQMLGLDDGEQADSDPVTVQGSFLSYLHLRHLRIRDLQRTCLSVLNYFRSIERTLTINDMGLISDDGQLKPNSNLNHRYGTEMNGSRGGGRGLGSHTYLHNTPVDFKMIESEFIEFSEVDNHDDFYTVDDARIHVVDQKGHYIMYDKALEDFGKLDKELQMIASYYIEKDQELRRATKLPRTHTQQAGDFDIPSYAHKDVDRYGVIFDAWTNEASFLECKRELLDCYFEAYQHVYDQDERRKLAQVITNIIHQRPRYDLQADYFVHIYRTEFSILRHHASLVKSILDKQIETQREYIQRVTREGDMEFGLPHQIIPKQPIAVNLSRPALKSVYMLEFHPTLSIASRIPAALKHAYWELHEVHKPKTLYSSLMMEKLLLQVALEEWERLPPLGSTYSMQVQKDLFSPVFAEDPLYICELAHFSVKQQEEQGGRKSHKEKQIGMVQTIGRLMEIVTLRQRMIDAAWECEILSKIYKTQATEMGFPDYHMNIRFVQFEFANFKEKAGKPPPVFITAIQEDDTAVDKYSPSCLLLAIHELDEGHVGRFSFRSRDGFLQIIKQGGMESFQVVLQTQVLHKNALLVAVQQASICSPVKVVEWKSGRLSPAETKSEKSSLTQLTSTSSGTSGPNSSGNVNSDNSKYKKAAEAFFSLQLEKTPSRDLMLNEFVSKKQQMGSGLKNPEELEKVKRKLISEFCFRFHNRVSHASMRGQLLAYYNSILNILNSIPSVRDTYFVMGEANEKKTAEDSLDGLKPDSRTLKRRPRRLLSNDGRHVLNIWFIPHYTEVLVMFKTLDDDACSRALSYSVSIVAALHDMLENLSAHAHLGTSQARMGSEKIEFVSADWGGTEGIGSELRDIQKQIENLPDPSSPEDVLELLTLKRDVMFLELDTAVRNSMTDTFLSTNNIQAYKSIVNNAFQALSAISNVQRESLMSAYLTVPEPLEARDLIARQIFPWRSFINSNGPFPIAFWQWFRIESYIMLCLIGLTDVERHVANGEILGVSLLMEDVLQTGTSGVMFSDTDSRILSSVESLNEEFKSSKRDSVLLDLKDVSKALIVTPQQQSLTRLYQPLESYRLLHFFLLVWKCLEMVKLDWGKRRLMVKNIDNCETYKEYSKLYRNEILLPVLQSVARRLGQGDLYDNLILDTDVFVMPKGASEIEIRLKQLNRLLENYECHMISEVRKRVAKEITLALSERAREEEALPTDLWKRTVMSESFTMNRPHVAERFVNLLMSKVQETEHSVSFDSKHLQTCLAELARNIMAREKHNFESYSMYYENLLRVNHQLLFQREREIKHLKDQLKQVQSDTQVSVQCQMADEAHDLLIEVTALRAKIAEMREMSLTQERDIRERVKEEYQDLIHNMFNSTYTLRSKFDQFRNDLHDNVLSKISETRKEAVEAISKLQYKFKGISDEEKLKSNLSEAKQLRHLQTENHQLNQIILKMKTMNIWRQNVKQHNFHKSVYDYETCIGNRPLSSGTTLTKSRSRATSAGLSGHSRPSTVSSHWPPPVPWPANRSLTPVGEVPISINQMNNNEKKIQRPKTVGGRLRSRIAEQLLCDLEPDTHRTIVQFGLLEGNKKVEKF